MVALRCQHVAWPSNRMCEVVRSLDAVPSMGFSTFCRQAGRDAKQGRQMLIDDGAADCVSACEHRAGKQPPT